MNIRIDIEYDGEPYHGWQRQGDLPTVQKVIEDCLQEITGERVIVHGSGRTDSGVHAKNQVACFYSDFRIPPERWSLALNTKLPFDIRVLGSCEVPHKFHAQRSAKWKTYEYRILNRSYASALDRRVYFWPHALDWDKMRLTLPYFVGTRDFRAFQSGPMTTKTTTRTIRRFEIVASEEVPGLYRFIVEGNGFLKQMVRNIVGTVMEVGQGLKPPEWVEEVFRSHCREFAGRAAPARGLYLVRVAYE